MHNLSCYKEYFVLLLTVSKNMMIQMVDEPNTTLIGQDGKTLTLKALLYLNVAVHAQVCRLFCVVYIPFLSLVQLGYPAITIIFVVNQIICYNGSCLRYNEDPAITNIFFSTTTFVIAGFHCIKLNFPCSGMQWEKQNASTKCGIRILSKYTVKQFLKLDFITRDPSHNSDNFTVQQKVLYERIVF